MCVDMVEEVSPQPMMSMLIDKGSRGVSQASPASRDCLGVGVEITIWLLELGCQDNSFWKIGTEFEESKGKMSR